MSARSSSDRDARASTSSVIALRVVSLPGPNSVASPCAFTGRLRLVPVSCRNRRHDASLTGRHSNRCSAVGSAPGRERAVLAADRPPGSRTACRRRRPQRTRRPPEVGPHQFQVLDGLMCAVATACAIHGPLPLDDEAAVGAVKTLPELPARCSPRVERSSSSYSSRAAPTINAWTSSRSSVSFERDTADRFIASANARACRPSASSAVDASVMRREVGVMCFERVSRAPNDSARTDGRMLRPAAAAAASLPERGRRHARRRRRSRPLRRQSADGGAHR